MKKHLSNRFFHMNLVWLTINCSFSHSSLALPILQQASAHLAGIHWHAVDALTQDSPFDIALQVLECSPDVVAAPMYIFNRTTLLSALSRIKVLKPETVVVVGGPECLGEGAEELLAGSNFVDYVCSGEGEEIMPQLLEELLAGGDLPKKRLRVAEHPVSMCAPPCPTASPFFRTDKPFVQYETSRGCPFGCQYCTSAGSGVRYKNLKTVAEELDVLRVRGVREIRLIDRTFNTPEARGVELLRLFRLSFPEVRFHLEIHPQFLPQGIRDELRKANRGQLHIEAGIQSLHNEVLEAVGRLPNAERALEGLCFLVSLHPLFDTHCDLLAGLPRQTYQGLVEDLKRLVEVHPAEIQLEVLKILPGTILRRRADELGIRFSRETPYDVMQTPDMSMHDIAAARRLSRMVDLFYNHPALTRTFVAANEDHPTFIDELLNHLTLRTDMLKSQTPSLDSRMKMLHGFFANDETGYDNAHFELDQAWLRLANTPGKQGVPAESAVLIDVLPEGAVAVAGDAAKALAAKGTRLWMIQHGAEAAIFAYNRGISPNHAAAEWRWERDSRASRSF